MNLRPSTVRPLAPRCRGGASSLLRLSAAAANRWPTAAMLTALAGHPATPREAAPSPLFTRLWPSGASNAAAAKRLAA